MEMYNQLRAQIQTLNEGLEAANKQNEEMQHMLTASQAAKMKPPGSHEQKEDDGEESGEISHTKSKRQPRSGRGDQEDPLTQIQAQLDGLKKQVMGKAPTTVEDLVQETDSPFTEYVMRVPLPGKFKMPQIEAFNGVTDPLDHLETYKNLMTLQGVSDPIMCRAFPVTLKGIARMWFNKLKPGSVGSFKELSRSFVSHFIAGQKYSKPDTYLATLKQKKGESLKDFTARFTRESMQVENLNDKVAINAYINGLWSGKLLYELTKDSPETMAELLMRAQRHMNAEDALNARHIRDPDVEQQVTRLGNNFHQEGKRREVLRRGGGDQGSKRPDRRNSPPGGQADKY